MATQMSHAPRTALGRDQHDIAHKRLKVDLFLAATTGFARKSLTLQSQLRNQGKPCPARTAPRHPKRKITGYRPTVATEIFCTLPATPESRAPRTALEPTQKTRQPKAPNL
jgi:hypothetical protein